MSTQALPLIGFGAVWHRRTRPVEHVFSYPSYFLMLPLRSLRERPCPRLNRNRFGCLGFFDRDHGAGGDDALAWFEDLLAHEGVFDADGEIWLQTFPRVLGYVFKPVSFWFAHRADGSLAAVLAEVNNTFGERHAYLLSGPTLGWGAAVMARKVFHVSPFCEVAGTYSFRFERSTAADGSPLQSTVSVDLHDAQGPLVQTCQGGALVPLSAASAQRAFFGYPFMTVGVILRIHWQALRLWIKRVPFVSKPPAPQHSVSRSA